MIYQFKVNLKRTSPPVWRRLQVEGNTSFYDFHQVMQLAFDWEDSHLHSFIMLRSNGRKTDVEIGSIDEEMVFPFFSFRSGFDEHEEKIAQAAYPANSLRRYSSPNEASLASPKE